MNYQLQDKLTVVHCTTSFQLNANDLLNYLYIELSALSWMYSVPLNYLYIELPAFSWMYNGTLNYQQAAEFTVVNWATTF